MIFFEEIKPVHFWVIQWYLWRKEKIVFLRTNKSCQSKGWFKNCVSNGYLKRSTISFELGFSDGFYYDAAFDNAKNFFNDYAGKSILRRMKELYGNSRSDLAFKKVLTHRLARSYYLNYVLSEIRDRYPEDSIVFIPSNGVELYRTDGCDIYDYDKFYKQAQGWEDNGLKAVTAKIPLWSRVISQANALKRKFILTGKIVILPVWLILRCVKNSKKNLQSKQSYDYAITVVSPNRQFANKIQKVDFLVDGARITKKQVVFMAPKGMTKEGKAYFIENGFNFIEDVTGFISLKEVMKIFPTYCVLLGSVLKEQSFIGEVSLKGIYFFAVWKSLCRNITIKKLVTHCDYEVKTIFRNIILEQGGCRTYLYMDSSNFGCFAAKKDSGSEFRHHYLGFLSYDYFISWNDKAIEYFQRSFCQFRQCINLGCLWGEHVRLIRERALPDSGLKGCLYQNGYRNNMKLVSVFDSTFHDNSMTSYDDGIKFLKGLCGLIDDLPDTFFILKEKNSRSYHETISMKYEEINALYKKLEDHPRCYFPGKKENSSKMIALSDLTISFPFTSTSLEALSAGKKAVWYDASGKFWDAYYDEVPGLVCHSYGELLARSKELLFETSEDAYNEYLDRQVKGKVESYLDGGAITRFRNLLNNSFEASAESIDMRSPIAGKY